MGEIDNTTAIIILLVLVVAYLVHKGHLDSFLVSVGLKRNAFPKMDKDTAPQYYLPAMPGTYLDSDDIYCTPFKLSADGTPAPEAYLEFDKCNTDDNCKAIAIKNGNMCRKKNYKPLRSVGPNEVFTDMTKVPLVFFKKAHEKEVMEYAKSMGQA
jgi:hypothetical protein